MAENNRTNEIYTTLNAASEAAKKLGATSARTYIKLYHQDIGLPSNPSVFYNDWKSWHSFLGTTKRADKYYKTLKKASVAARALKIATARDYIKNYRLDTRLHSIPSQFYEDWISWEHFLK